MAKAKVWYLCTHGDAKMGPRNTVDGVKVPAPVNGKTKCPQCERVLDYRKGTNVVTGK